MIIQAIDPGARGCIVELDSDAKTCRYLNMPMLPCDILDYDKLNECFPAQPHMIFIEQVHGRQPWGAGNVFTFGYNTGLITAWLYKKPHTKILPQTWQQLAHLGTKGDDPKYRSWQAFNRLNPKATIKKSQDGLIDAYHIARYGLFHYRCVFHDNWEFIKCI